MNINSAFQKVTNDLTSKFSDAAIQTPIQITTKKPGFFSKLLKINFDVSKLFKMIKLPEQNGDLIIVLLSLNTLIIFPMP